jgi:hypothetical protein
MKLTLNTASLLVKETEPVLLQQEDGRKHGVQAHSDL